MSSKKLVYLLTVLIVCGFMATGTAQGQTFGTVIIKGSITNPDGTPAAGLDIEAAPAGIFGTATSRDDGTFSVFSARGAAQGKLSVGDTITLTVRNANGDILATEGLPIEAADIAGNTLIIDGVEIQLRDSGIVVELDPAAPYGNGTDETTITVTVIDEGTGVTGDTVTIDSAGTGTVGEVTEVGNGVYTATYTTPIILGEIPAFLTITARSSTTGLEGSFNTVVLPPPTTVSVEVAPSIFMADTPGSTGTVTVTVRKAAAVTDETVELTLSPQVGELSAVTNNLDGTYTAIYTSGGIAEPEVTLTATATRSGASDEATIVINAGPPAKIALSANPMTVSSLGSSTITAKVTDVSGNPVGALTLTGAATSGGTVGAFASTVFGTYTATYSAPMVDAEGTEMITVSTAGISNTLMLDLTPEPPIDVSLISIQGVVYKEDGEVPADGEAVTVRIGSNPPDTDTTDMNGGYSSGAIVPGGAAATTGDIVIIAVANANVVSLEVNSITHSGSEFPLGNDILERVQAGEPVTVNVTTDIHIPPRSVSLLTVQGTVFKESSTAPAGGGLEVTVTVGSNPPQMDTTDASGFYSVGFVTPGTPVATTGDSIAIEVRDGSGVRSKPQPPEKATLSNTDLGTDDSAIVIRDVETNIKVSSNFLVVEGTVYLKNGDTPVAAMSHLRESDLTVVVTNTTRGNLTESAPVRDDGTYGVVFQSLGGAAVAETGDELTVTVEHEVGKAVGSKSRTLTGAEVQAAKVEVDVPTNARAVVNTLHVIGDVINADGSPAPGVQVTISVIMDGNVVDQKTPTTDPSGGYEEFFLKLGTPLAATGDSLLVEALDANQFRGQHEIMLSSHQLLNQPVVVPSIELTAPFLKLGGLSINPGYTGIQDPMIQRLLGMDLPGLVTAAGDLAGETVGVNPLVALPPSAPLLLSPILTAIGAFQLELPAEFDPDSDKIAQESFGNSITTRPTAWAALPAAARFPGRWVNGDQLNLYISGASTINEVTFTLNGSESDEGRRVSAGETFNYVFQLEEELIALFEGHMPAFGAVQLMIDGHPMPHDMVRSDTGVWSAEAPLSPGEYVLYYYMITLARPYVDPGAGLTITTFPLIDPRNRQVRTDGLSQVLEVLLGSELTDLAGVRSVFKVPEVTPQQSLWVGRFDLATNVDGPYTLDVDVNYRGGYSESITADFILDQTAPTADVAINPSAPGMNIGMYPHPTDQGVYVATGPEPGEASLTISIPSATSNEPDGIAGYLFQLARLDAGNKPGAWNPVVVADLLPLNLEKLLTNPASVLPLTGGSPIDMLIRNSGGGALYGRYGIRAVGIDSLLNMDSGKGPGVVVDLVPPDPDSAMVSYVTADFDGNGVIEGLEMQSTAGDVVVFSDSLVTLTVDVVERTVHPLASIAIEVEMPGLGSQSVAVFSGEQLAATMLGDQFTAVLPVPDIPGLPDRGSHAILRTVTTNALNVESTQEVSVAYERRTPPEVSAVHTTVTDRHPNSHAAQGMITVSAFTQAMTSPDATAVQFEYRRAADADWTLLPGGVQIADTTVTSHVQIAIIEDLVNSIVSGSPTAPVSLLYREWPLTIDSTILEDTITVDGVLASEDDNPYVVRAIVGDAANVKHESAPGVTASFSLDNYSSTEITQVADEVKMVDLDEDGSYHVSGLIHDSVPAPMLRLTAWTGAHPNAFPGGLKLAVNNAAGEAVEIDETAFGTAGNHNYMATFKLDSIPNGMYTFMAVAHTADGATEERIAAMTINVTVGNFTPPENFADPTADILAVVNTRGDTHSPSEIDAQYATGFPAMGDQVCVTLIVPNVYAGDVDVLIGDDGMSAAMMGALTVMDPDADKNISICLDTSGLDEGMYGLVGTVTKPNGSVQFGLPSIQVDRSAPVIEIVSPVEGHQVSSLPTIQVAYSDATGFDPEKLDPRAIEITLTRLGSHKAVTTNPEMIRAVTAAGEVLTQSGSFSYTHDDALSGGAYRIDVSVTDALNNTGTAESVEFTSSGVEAAVTITSPAGGQSYDLKQPMVVEAMLAGNGAITVTEFTLNGTAVNPVVKDNSLSYAVRPTLERYFRRGYSNFVVIKIEDEEGNTAEATAQFTIALDTTPPQVVSYSPQGTVRTDKPVITVTASDESGIRTNFPQITVDAIRSGDQTSSSSGGSATSVFTPANAVGPGTYTVTANVEDKQGNRIRFQWTFAVELDVTPPSITATSPHGVIRTDSPTISVSASDDMSGVDTIEISVTDGTNAAVQGNASVASDKTSATFTPAGTLSSGVYSVQVQVTDMRGNTASSQWQFTIELDTIPPSILSTRPTQEHTENRRPTISATYTDNMSGVNAGSVTLWVDGTIVQPDSVSETQVVYTPAADLDFGQHTVKLKVSDNAPKVNTADQEWVFFVERMGIADARNYPNPFEDETMIAFRVSRQASISIRVYDFTGRLVAEPVTNQIHEAGLVEIDWHAETDAGDHLARGVYFCHILMESELEPQSAILKMAVISE